MNSVRNILIVDDEPMIARNLEMILSDQGHNCQLCFKYACAIDKLGKECFDLILLDINLSGQYDGIQIAQCIRKHFMIPFIFITSYVDANTIAQAKVTGPAGYIVKPFRESDIITTVEIALYNHQNLMQKMPDRTDINKRISDRITKTEYTILLDLKKGLTYTEIAKERFVTVNTVNTHVKNLYRKLRVNNKMEAVSFLNVG